MTSSGVPDVSGVLSRLKGFQRETVEYAFERLYLAPDSTHRFLVADEVGLGKTLVAKGIIAKAVEHLWQDIDRIDIVYICSNSQIAAQNVNRLRVTKQEFETADRLTLLPAKISDLQENKVNYLAFTPGTSFDLRSSLGRWDERVLLYWLIQGVWPRQDTGPKNLFQGEIAKAKNFRAQLHKFKQTQQIDRTLARAFKRLMKERGRSEGWGGEGLSKTYHELCDRFRYSRKHIPADDRRDRGLLISRLRSLLALTCVDALEPDLVILDEFQRFKQLLDGTDEPSLLAQQLFNYSDATSKVRLLLLSATPYKMYTLHHESHEDDHYKDFLRTVEFLDPKTKDTKSFESALQGYRRELYRIGDGGNEETLRQHKAQIEGTLRRVMCRTERLRGSQQEDEMLREIPAGDLVLEPKDVVTYSRLQTVGAVVNQPKVMEYWLSAPYLLNFMDDYKLKQEVRKQAKAPKANGELTTVLSGAPGLLLPWSELRQYGGVDPANARLRHFYAWLEELEAWRMLWLPPTLPYYVPGGAFRRSAEMGFSKRLIFSTWTVVPKTVAGLLSYEVERRILREFDPTAENTPDARRHRRPLLNFSESNERLSGMPVLGILYPSPTLAEIGDPLALARELRASEADRSVNLGMLQVLVEEKLSEALSRVVSRHSRRAFEDERWYWAAPILLDLEYRSARTKSWFDLPDLVSAWSGGHEVHDEGSRWSDHVERATQLVHGRLELGRPPADLYSVLALMALGGPAVCALRALGRRHGGGNSYWRLESRNGAGQVAWGFRSLFNQPEAMALLRATPGSREKPYWQQVLDYCARGCLQSVLDEYAHVLLDLEGLSDSSAEQMIDGLTKAMTTALALRTGTPRVDEVSASINNRSIQIEARHLRNHFAVRFGTQETEDGRAGAREDQVRTAFNSPFWPFVLTTTSVGQEGLDFHAYCHAVVHWNLPANPVDLEQREGRVHRYKGHAIRKNVAAVFGSEALRTVECDVWNQMFEIAHERVDGADHGLSPYWVFPLEGGAAVERHVPALPLSRDTHLLEALRRSLAVYRMVFGQPRQEDLTAYLLKRLSEDRLQLLKPLLQIDLSPNRAGEHKPGTGCANVRPTGN
jgi:helicase-like protein